MVAPTPVSALLHAVAVVKAGVFSIARVSGFIFGPSLLHDIGAAQILAAMAGATIIIASIIAIQQDDLKARLAYSTVGHLSYILLGCAILSPSAFTGALFHIVTHAAMKITLFFCAGAIYVTAHKTKISQLDGIGRRMPYTMGAFAIGALGLAGVPAIGGFLSKWYLAAGAAEAQQTAFLVILLISGVMNAGYLVPIVTRAFLKPESHDESGHHADHGEASNFMLIPILACAAMAVMLGVAPNAFFSFFTLATQTVGNITGAGAW
jgi:multicomponent Na+:H+ antiporter subunit D